MHMSRARTLLAYAPTKAALVNLTKAMAKALAKKQIRVNGVAAGQCGRR
jgi:hypothetical protein